MDYRSVGDLTTCHQIDAGQQSYVTVIPVEFGTSRPSSEHGYLDDRFSHGEYTQECLSKEHLMHDSKKQTSRYDELRFYNSDVGSGSASSQRSHSTSSANYDRSCMPGRRRLEQLDAYSPAVRYPAGTVTLGRRRAAQSKCRDPLDLGYYGTHTRAAATPASSIGGDVSETATTASERYRLSSVAASHLQHQYLSSQPTMHQHHHLQQRGYRQRQPHMSSHASSSQLASEVRYGPIKPHPTPKRQVNGAGGQSHRCYIKPVYGQQENANEQLDQTAAATVGTIGRTHHKVREAHSESSIQGLNLHTAADSCMKPAVTRAPGASTKFPPPPPPPLMSIAPPPSLSANQILPPPAGYQNQPSGTGCGASGGGKRSVPASISSYQPHYYHQHVQKHQHLPHQQQQQQQYAGGPAVHKTAHMVESIACKQKRTATPLRRVKKKVPPVEVCVFLMSQHAVRLECDDARDLSAAHLLQTVLEEEELALPPAASQVFGIWMISPLLEIQLKPHHQPLDINHHWQSLLAKYTSANEAEIAKDIPIISFQRSVFFPKRDEMRLKDARMLELLYEEARYNVLEGRYPCDPEDLSVMAALQARLELGVYDPDVHTLDYIRCHVRDYVPDYAVSGRWSWSTLMDSKSSLEARIVEQYARLPVAATRLKLMHRYLQLCWTLPCYGSVFFRGQVECPVRSLLSLLYRPDVPVLVAINDTGVHLIEQQHRTTLLSVNYDEMAWDFARPCQEAVRECLPCVFLQFGGTEFGSRVYHVLQVFSKQSVLMDALIASQVEASRQRARLYGSVNGADAGDEPDIVGCDAATAAGVDSDEPLAPTAPSGGRKQRCRQSISRLDRLTLATFAEHGECIRKMGSWSFSK